MPEFLEGLGKGGFFVQMLKEKAGKGVNDCSDVSAVSLDSLLAKR